MLKPHLLHASQIPSFQATNLGSLLETLAHPKVKLSFSLGFLFSLSGAIPYRLPLFAAIPTKISTNLGKSCWVCHIVSFLTSFLFFDIPDLTIPLFVEVGTYEADDNPKPNGRIRALEWPRSLSITSESTGYDEDSMQEHHSVSHVSVSSVDGHSVTYGDDEDCDDYVSSADPASRLEPSDSIPGLPQIPACDVPVPSVGQRKGQPASASSGERVQPHYGSHPRSYFPLVPYRHQPRPPLRDFSSETVTHSAGGRLITWPEGGSSSGQMNLGVYISRVRARLTGCLPNQQALAIDSTPGALIEFIDRVRLRMLPHQGSRLDRILHRADNLEEALAKFLSSIEMSHKFSNLKDFVLLVRACIKYLVQVSRYMLPIVPFLYGSCANLSPSVGRQRHFASTGESV